MTKEQFLTSLSNEELEDIIFFYLKCHEGNEDPFEPMARSILREYAPHNVQNLNQNHTPTFAELAQHRRKRDCSDDDVELIKARVYQNVTTIPHVIQNGAPKTPRPIYRLSRRRRTVALVVCLMVALAVCAYAVGFAPFTRLFGDGAIMEQPSGKLHNDDPTAQYPDLEAALLEYGHTYIAPTWIPERFTEVEISVIDELSGKVFLSSWYGSEKGDNLSILVVIALNPDTITNIETDRTTDHDAHFIYSAGNKATGAIDHVITTNIDVPIAEWTNSFCICTISGNVSVVELEAIIDSIYK